MPQDDLRTSSFSGAAILDAEPAFQSLHVAVFREWPYLFAGNAGGRSYIAKYAGQPRAALFLASHAGTPVGARSAMDVPGWLYADLDPAAIAAVREGGAVLNHRDYPAALPACPVVACR